MTGDNSKMTWQEKALRERITDATEELLADRDFASLQVKEICERAEISRQTFYRYYRDKYEIIQWHFLCICESTLFEMGRSLGWDEAEVAAIKAIYARKTLYMKAYQDSKNYQSISAFGHRMVRQSLIETIVEHRKLPLTEELEFQVNYFANATLITFTNWGKKGMRIHPEKFARLLTCCAPRELYELLKDPMPVASSAGCRRG
ncbi:TetR/AcrR family transcriptional regulator [Xiamenia xianingshaonis]|uniref:TetR family transcriptional regulator n=1 Tax=Xiamenia xianingshaonis TaxID=2682776 RepID=A0ABX0IFU4_9ACTN|nr:TetR/AcrR family transcriptional regulator [Xiamenia xianingshaonis]NHM13600.1 TetR family transcriptional regulator [Xiamenia xianingshaonis]